MYSKVNYFKGAPLKDGKKLIEFTYKTYRGEPQISSDNSLIVRHKKKKMTSGRASFSFKAGQFNHLNWIAGIKIGQSAFSQVSNDPNGAQFANLGEEVSGVGHNFPKLRFEKISVSTGNLTVSLNGPWATGSEDLIFLRVEIDFPPKYPSKNGIPKFKVDGTHELTEEKRKDILANLETISKKYCSADRFCLEPCFRFLLGEKVNLDFQADPAVTFGPFEFKDTSGNDNNSEDEMITTDDDNNRDTFLSIVSEQDESDEDDYDEQDSVVEVKKPTFNSVPIAKGCGAIWTPSGHLVCFFVNQKQDKKSQQQIIKFGQQGFSLAKHSKRKPQANTMLSNEIRSYHQSDESDYDSDTDSLSSEDSLNNDFEMLQSDKLYRMRIPTNIGPFASGPAAGRISQGARSGTIHFGNTSVPTDRSAQCRGC
ncbi:unnamed protein product [Ambrosiozyma monospora]|uniref:Unnamed protein product n=1 Tax=Ambrosiozyma monospora TaxID=43982 RepID=A0ACB5TFD3_AMBMO|nr:unnamed protein product [Ambrosiozyma monospora]